VSLKEEAHLNTCFKHFVLFTWVSELQMNLDSLLDFFCCCWLYAVLSKYTGGYWFWCFKIYYKEI